MADVHTQKPVTVSLTPTAPLTHTSLPTCSVFTTANCFDSSLRRRHSPFLNRQSNKAPYQYTDIKLAGKQRRSFSEKGGLLNRMFGSSPKDNESAFDVAEPESALDDPKSAGKSPSGRKSEDSRQGTSPPAGEKKRRSSGVGRAREMLSNAKNSLYYPMSQQTGTGEKSGQSPMQKLGRTDPALSVPQGSLNNSAGESHPGPRSTFRVGVTEDKNKKCRRTMEDTHAYLYNFLSTPAPAIGSNSGNQRKSITETGDTIDPQPVVETDNGYFAIFDGHAGTFAADWCGKKVHVLLEEIIRKNPNTPIPELLDQTFTSVDQQLEKLPLKNSGCTAVIAVLRWEDRIPNAQSATGSTSIAPAAAAAVKAASESKPAHNESVNETMGNASSGSISQPEAKLREAASRQRVLYTANVGDARIVLCRNGKALRLSYDHKGSDENEGKRIAGAGGLILNNRVNGVLAVTRALGDAYMKDLVTGHPYTTETVIQPDIDEFLILACDGVSTTTPTSDYVLIAPSSGMSAPIKKPSTSFVAFTTHSTLPEPSSIMP